MKKIVFLFCSLALLFASSNVFAAGDVILASGITSSQKKVLNSTEANSNLLLTSGSVKMLKSVSGDFLILTFSDSEGLGKDVYSSILQVLSVILTEEHLSYFKGKYPSILNDPVVSFAGFRVRQNPSRLSIEKQYFDENDNILRVEVCLNEFDDIPNVITPVPSLTPTPSQAPTPDIENPSTSDIEPFSFILCLIIATSGLIYSVRKILAN